MKVDILREIPWFGGNYFHPTYFDDTVFKMESCLRAGKSVPSHYHKYFDEHWFVKQGNPTFIVGKEKHKRQPGDTFIAPKNVIHGLLNDGKEDVILETEMRPAADMAKMMSVIAGLQDDKEKNPMLKFFYIEKKAGLKEFSTPSDVPLKIMTALFMPLTLFIGNVSGWDNLIDKYI